MKQLTVQHKQPNQSQQISHLLQQWNLKEENISTASVHGFKKSSIKSMYVHKILIFTMLRL